MDNYNEILNTMEKAYEKETGFVPNQYSDTGIRFRLFAGELYNLKTELEWFKRQMFPNTATGKYLDYHAEERGLNRRGGIKAQGEVLFALEYAAEYPVTIPKGTVVSTENTVPLRFVTKVEKTIPIGTTFIKVPTVAEAVGKSYNVAPQKIENLLTSIPGVIQVINLESFTGGTDVESDEELRERLLYTYRNIDNGTNIAFYKNLAESVEGVYSAGVIPKNRGVGTVDVFIAKEGEQADSPLVGKVAEVMQKAREVNVNVSVSSAQKVMVDVAVNIGIENGYDFDDVSSRCRAAIKNFILRLGVGKQLFMSDIGEVVYHTPGVRCYNFNRNYGGDYLYAQSRLPVANRIIIDEIKEVEDDGDYEIVQ
ncbi:MAG: baseplate J/gp47 family protein [Oscillospiraceae bacterium]|nr:baseplate J/gp47 family protein [Oscillospiraceae bacterium]